MPGAHPRAPPRPGLEQPERRGAAHADELDDRAAAAAAGARRARGTAATAARRRARTSRRAAGRAGRATGGSAAAATTAAAAAAAAATAAAAAATAASRPAATAAATAVGLPVAAALRTRAGPGAAAAAVGGRRHVGRVGALDVEQQLPVEAWKEGGVQGPRVSMILNALSSLLPTSAARRPASSPLPAGHLRSSAVGSAPPRRDSTAARPPTPTLLAPCHPLHPQPPAK
jgi:hypothetical protein